MQSVEKPTSWRDGEFVRADRAAEITGLSTNYVRQLIGCGGLSAVQFAPGGTMMITVESLVAFVDSALPVTPGDALRARKPKGSERQALNFPARRHSRGSPNLRLVVDNTAK